MMRSKLRLPLTQRAPEAQMLLSFRMSNGWTQKRLAIETGIKAPYIAYLESSRPGVKRYLVSLNAITAFKRIGLDLMKVKDISISKHSDKVVDNTQTDTAYVEHERKPRQPSNILDLLSKGKKLIESALLIADGEIKDAEVAAFSAMELLETKKQAKEDLLKILKGEITCTSSKSSKGERMEA